MTKKRKIQIASTVGYVICILAEIWPVALIGNRITPFVMGLPFMFFWYTIWPLILFIGLVGLYWLDAAEDM